MKNVIGLIFLVTSFSIYANCDSFLDEKIKAMGLGSLNTPNCGITKTDKDGVIRLGLFSKGGRKDMGPSVRLSPIDGSEDKKIKLKFGKDHVSKREMFHHFTMNSNCTEVKSLRAKMGGIDTTITYEKCRDIEGQFSIEQIKHFQYSKLCNTYFPEKEDVDNVAVPGDGAIAR